MRFSSGDIHCLVLDSREGLQLAAVELGQPVLVLLEHLVDHVADFAQTAGLDALPRASMKFLLKGTQPIVPVLARRLYKTVPPELREALEAGRPLIVSPVPETTRRVDAASAALRNRT